MKRNLSGIEALIRKAIENGSKFHPVPMTLSGERMDSDAINLSRDFTARLGEVYRDKFPALRALEFVPMLDAALQQTSTGFIGEFLSRVGEAKILTEVSTDVPMVVLRGETFSGRVAMYGAAGAWNQVDIFRASVGMVNLPTETQRAARETIETKTDELISLGELRAQIPGFLSHPDVATVPFTLGNWSTRTFEQCVSDFHTWIGAAHARVGYVESSMLDTVILPPAAKAVLIGKRNTFNVSAWTAIVQEAKDHYGITVDTWSRTATAGAGGAARVVGYRRDPKCLGAVVPMTYTQFSPQEKGFQVIVPALASCGGAVVIEPATVTYSDNALA